MRAMSTPVGHSRRHALQPRQRSIASYSSGDAQGSSPSCPESASRSAFARPRVEWRSSLVARNDGHITPGLRFRQVPLLLHMSTAREKPPHFSQSSAVGSFRVSSPLRARRSEASFMRGGSTILPGFRRSSGSKRRLISPKAETRRFPSIGSRNSDRIQPSPCSPECEPPRSPASANASAAIARRRSTSSPSRRSRAGRTCRQPTDACAYHTACVAWRSMISVSRRCHSGRRSRGMAQSSMKASGLRAVGRDIEMLSPALRSDHIRL